MDGSFCIERGGLYEKTIRHGDCLVYFFIGSIFCGSDFSVSNERSDYSEDACKCETYIIDLADSGYKIRNNIYRKNVVC